MPKRKVKTGDVVQIGSTYCLIFVGADGVLKNIRIDAYDAGKITLVEGALTGLEIDTHVKRHVCNINDLVKKAITYDNQ